MEKRILETLIELLQDYIIEIPRIQRDYVQGNNDEETKIIRDKLLKDIKESVESVNLDNEAVEASSFSQLDLNFVYGKRQGEKFIPLDGQQRLTTLYLIYLYAYAMDSLSQADVDKDNEEKDTELFLRFTYDTRISSRQFFECIAKNRKEIFASGNRPSYEIKDSSWFLDGWKYDPTINSALVMLDEIAIQFKDVKMLKKRLNNKKKPLVFQFKDIEELGMEDSLYIKLNARGKVLSPFENFKSQLIGRIEKMDFNKSEDEEKKLKEEIKMDFDGKWTDCIWKLKKMKTKDMSAGLEDKFDEVFLRLFEIILMNKKIIRSDNINIWWGREDVYRAIDEEVVMDIKYILDFMCRHIDIVTNCANTNNVVSEEEKNIQILLDYFVEPICKKESITYIDRLYFHSAMIYIHKCDGYPETKDIAIGDRDIIESTESIAKSKEGDLESWIRIIKNLIENTQLDRDDLFESALKQLGVFANEYKDLTGYVASFYINGSKINSNITSNNMSGNTVNISGFNTEQIKEEIIKAAIIINERKIGRQKFTKAIYEAESNRYFRGQIRVALYRAKNQTSAVNCIFGYDEVKFVTQWEKIDMLFSNNTIRQEDYYNQIRRALLTFGDYRLLVNNYYYTLCISDNNEHSRTPSFRSLFSEFDKMQNGNKVVDDFLAALNTKSGIPIEEQLKKIIKKNSAKIGQNDWRYCIINYPDNIIKMNRQHLRMRTDTNGVWYMVPGKMSNGYNYDLYLNTIILEIRKSIHWVEEYWCGYYGIDTEKYIRLYNKVQRCYMYVSTEYSATRGYYYRIIDTIDDDKKKNIIMETKTRDLITEMINYLKKII